MAAQGFTLRFSADTEVATDEGDTLRAISQIQIGDYVLAWDEETNTISFYPVTDTIHHTDETIFHLTIDGETLETTPEHPFYPSPSLRAGLKAKAGWKPKTCTLGMTSTKRTAPQAKWSPSSSNKLSVRCIISPLTKRTHST
ncbi:MAG TPA: Hint domain-containing protein [Anaerolineales bacterium]|nr:Hint domain-containing protein [Anaerolineales bacterium]